MDAPVDGRERGGERGWSNLVPGVGAAQKSAGALLTGPLQGYRAPAVGLGAAARKVLAKGRVLVIGHAHEVRVGEFGPGHARLVGLAESGAAAAAGEADGFDLCAAHGALGASEQ